MLTKAAVIWGSGQRFEVSEIELDQPKANEVLVRFVAAGLCHSDYHLVTGDIEARFPMVGGHEGAGIVEAVGPGVTRVKPGDHIVSSFSPACGQCRWCVTGQQNLCDLNEFALVGHLVDKTFRFHGRGQDIGGMCMLGTFSERAVISEYSCVKIDESIPLEVACLVSCGVPTGWGSAVVAADVRPGETIVIYGSGGIGINAVQGARAAGAKNIVVVDPVAFKLEMARKLGATHAVASAEEARDVVQQLTNGVWADKAIVTVGVTEEQVVQNAFDITRKGGTLVVTAMGPNNGPNSLTLHVSGFTLTAFQKRIQGAFFGNQNPHYEIKKLLDLYRSGHLKVEELITRRYKLEEINQGYQDMLDGKNIRGIIVFPNDA